MLDSSAPRPDPADASLLLVVIAVSGLAIIVGLAMHVARAIVVREPLWEGRYRGPSVIALLVLAIIAANAASVSVASDVLAVTEGRAPSTLGALVLLTVTQAALLAVAGLFVAAPRALAGLRLVAERGLLRSLGLGVLLAVPAWIGAPAAGRHHRAPAGADRPAAGCGRGGSRHQPGRPGRAGDRPGGGGPGGRGDLLPRDRLQRLAARVRVWRAIVGSAALFALIHGSIFVIPAIFGLGIALALLYRRTGSLPASMAMHATFNGITLAHRPAGPLRRHPPPLISAR